MYLSVFIKDYHFRYFIKCFQFSMNFSVLQRIHTFHISVQWYKYYPHSDHFDEGIHTSTINRTTETQINNYLIECFFFSLAMVHWNEKIDCLLVYLFTFIFNNIFFLWKVKNIFGFCFVKDSFTILTFTDKF